MSKSERYFYDADAVRVACSPNTNARRKDGERVPAKGTESRRQPLQGDGRKPGPQRSRRRLARTSATS